MRHFLAALCVALLCAGFLTGCRSEEGKGINREKDRPRAEEKDKKQ